MGGLELPWQPGTNFLYSDFGFGLLGTILSNLLVPDVPMSDPPPFQRALDTAFLDSLGLSSTVLETPDTNPATPYSASGVPTFRWDNTNAFSGGGGLISSAEDMGTMVARHLDYPAPDAPLGVRTMAETVRPVSAITTACATTSLDSCAPASFQMGLAWQLYGPSEDIPVPTAYKNGGTAGTSTDTLLAPTMGIGVTTMFNRTGIHVQLANAILRLLVASAPNPTPAPPTPAPEGGGAALAESGGTTGGLLVPLSVAAVLLAAGGIAHLRRSAILRADARWSPSDLRIPSETRE
ncbi:serine hydrolase [Microbacterium sp. SLBN-146]|uniref:serine hydrolase domain-containing protein n=1 Tax=Microbacterium sp. SLBN-146 TaxID=2768457 RepID=UPI001154E881|nr:serine hydrolase domain-containing protein [Microbacterium sp. SLBN-146]